jgi:CheY-like chemotaxis protein
MDYRILIVDEDADSRRQQAEALVAAPPFGDVSYHITTTGSAAAAKLQAARRHFHLVIAPLRNNSESLELATELRDVFPHLKVLLLADTGLSKQQIQDARQIQALIMPRAAGGELMVRSVARLLGISNDGVLPEILYNPGEPEADEDPITASIADIEALLGALRRQAHAQLALYTDYIGTIIAQNGDASDIEVPALTALVAGSFVNAIELGRVLRDPETSHLAVHEGQFFDVYATNAGSDHFLILVFAREFVDPKLGFVSLLLKRTAGKLRRLRLAEGKPVDQASRELDAEFDRLFGSELIRLDP